MTVVFSQNLHIKTKEWTVVRSEFGKIEPEGCEATFSLSAAHCVIACCTPTSHSSGLLFFWWSTPTVKNTQTHFVLFIALSSPHCCHYACSWVKSPLCRELNLWKLQTSCRRRLASEKCSTVHRSLKITTWGLQSGTRVNSTPFSTALKRNPPSGLQSFLLICS